MNTMWPVPGMVRKLRFEYEGSVYHVLNRGDRREAIFVDEEDRQYFLATLGEACAKIGWQAHELCLTRNPRMSTNILGKDRFRLGSVP